MTVSVADLDAHEQPSDEMRAEWKYFSRLDEDALYRGSQIDDPRLPLEENGFCKSGTISRAQLAEAFAHLQPGFASEARCDVPIIYHPLLPGLLIVPALVPPTIQASLLNRMIHRDLSNPIHQTNLHLHYTLPYPPTDSKHTQNSPSTSNKSFFSYSPDSPPNFIPKEPSLHKPLSIKQVLQRRLHWVTLGGQYDWTNRIYPEEAPPQFPVDLSAFLTTLFPETVAQAAIVNFYTPGDTMMMHRDVSEETDKGLVSLSLGCDGLFMIAPSAGPDGHAPVVAGDKKYLLLRLRSGDAIYMTKESRYAWHGVPKVLKDTCPEYLADWPAGGEDGEFEEWRGWIRNRRINLNVRQMRD